MRVRTLASTATLAMLVAGFTAFQQPAMAVTDATLYVDRGAASCTDSGTGAQAAPYCTIQAAANAAVAGDTVLISGDDWGFANYDENVVIGKSGTASAPITFKAAQNAFRVYGQNAGFKIQGSYIHVEGANLSAVSSNASLVISGTNDVVDRSFIGQSGSIALELTGSAADDTVERSRIDLWSEGVGIRVDSQAHDVTISTDVFNNTISATPIDAEGSVGLNITSNTFMSNCATAISLSNSSQTTVENNLITPDSCFSSGTADLTVDAASSSSTTVGYNLLSTAGGKLSGYSWAGTTYSSADAFRTATGQGTADIVVPGFDPGTNAIAADNPVIDSANSSAPGELATDANGNSRADDPSVPNSGAGTVSFYDRGAVEYREFTDAAATAYQDDPQRVTASLSLQGFAWGQSAMYTITWGDGTEDSQGLSDNGQLIEASSQANHMYAAHGTYTITQTVADSAQTVSKTLTITTHGSNYIPVPPTRVLDTRKGVGAPKAKIAANGTVAVDVTSGVAGAPAASTITAVVLNVTITNPTVGGYITAYPDGGTRPKSSNLNFSAGETVPNLATVKVGNGKVDLYNGSGGTSDLIADVQGYYVDAAGSGFTAIAPSRLLDTRKGIGAPAQAVAPGGTVALQVAGAGSIPATGVSAVAVNVTATGPTGGGYVTVYPDQTTMPTASNLNYSPGETVPNMVVVKVGANGKVDLHNTSSGTVQLIADVAGYYSTSGGDAFVPTDPTRLLDTRTGTGQEAVAGMPAAPNSDVRWWVDDEVRDETALVLNVTVTNPKAGGYITAYPSGATRPTASNLNFSAGETVPNMVMVSAAPGSASLFNGSAGTTDLIADMFGYFS